MNKESRIIQYVSCFISDEGELYEEIYNAKTSKGKFITWDNGKLKTAEYVDIGDIRFLPIVNKVVRQKAVLLPSNAEPYESLETLTDEIHDHIYRYVDITDKYRRISSWYIPSTWFIDKIGTTGYLRALGDFGTGKSRFKRVIGGLCYKPIIISGAVTAAPIFRLIEQWNGTLVFDEMDMKYTDESNLIVKILNCGNERNNPIIRCNPKNPSKLDLFETFGPKVFCTRRRFEDPALESRCLTEITKQTSRTDIPSLLLDGDSFFEEEMELRNKLLMLKLKNWKNIVLTPQSDIDFGPIEPRLKQDILPIAMLFWKYENIKNSLKLFINNYNEELVQDRINTKEGKVVNAIFDIIGDENLENINRITSSDISMRMYKLYKLNNEPNSAQVGRILRSLGLQTKPIKINGKTRRVLELDNECLNILKRKYVPVVTGVTEVTAVTGQRIEVNKEKSMEGIHNLFECQDPRAVTTVTTETTVTPSLFEKIRTLEKFFRTQGPYLEECSIDVFFGMDFRKKCLEHGIINERPTGDYEFNGCAI